MGYHKRKGGANQQQQQGAGSRRPMLVISRPIARPTTTTTTPNPPSDITNPHPTSSAQSKPVGNSLLGLAAYDFSDEDEDDDNIHNGDPSTTKELDALDNEPTDPQQSTTLATATQPQQPSTTPPFIPPPPPTMPEPTPPPPPPPPAEPTQPSPKQSKPEPRQPTPTALTTFITKIPSTTPLMFTKYIPKSPATNTILTNLYTQTIARMDQFPSFVPGLIGARDEDEGSSSSGGDVDVLLGWIRERRLEILVRWEDWKRGALDEKFAADLVEGWVKIMETVEG
ncbi:hypothetical protein HDU76_008488, partial [Blyttiomyces sp. JEL0837]